MANHGAATGILATVSILAFAIGFAAAQPDTTLGGQIRSGDADYVPTIATASNLTAILRADHGDPASMADDAFYLDMDDSRTISLFDVRLVPPAGRAPGSTLGDADQEEADRPATILGAPGSAAVKRHVYVDASRTGFYNAGDWLYFTTAPSGLPPTDGGVVTIRLTQAAAYPAGTLVRPGDTDALPQGVTVASIEASYAWVEADHTAAFSAADHAYVMPTTSGTQAGAIVPLSSVRLTAANPAGSFGSQIRPTDSDYVPVIGGNLLELNKAGDGIGGNHDRALFMRLAFGVASDITDDCVILNTDGSRRAGPGSEPTVTDHDLRLTPCQGNAPGTPIGAESTTEKQATIVAQADGAASTSDAVTWADANNNGRYDLGDYVYYVRNPAGASSASLKTPANLGAATEAFTVRLTAAAGRPAGSFVFAQDPDYGGYATITAPLPGGARFVTLDVDQSNSFNGEDAGFIVAGEAKSGLPIPLNSIRVTANNPAGAFGTHVRQGHDDHAIVTSSFPPVLVEAPNSVIRLAFGVRNDINDDCVVLNMDADPLPTTFDVRAVACQGKAPGTLIDDQSLVEKQASADPSTANTRVRFADVNNNGRYDAGDLLYLVVDTGKGMLPSGLVAPTVDDAAGASQFTLRLTATAGKPAGTIAFPPDTDFINYRGQARDLNPLGAFETFSWFDADLTGSYTRGDWLFLAPGNSTGPLGPGQPFSMLSLRWTDPTLAKETAAPTNTGTGVQPTPTGTGNVNVTESPAAGAIWVALALVAVALIARRR